MHLKKTTVWLLIIALMTVVLLSGCSDSKKEPINTDQKVNSEQSGKQETSETENNFNPTGYPIVNDSITLKFFASRSPLASTPYEDMKVLKDHEARTNVKIEWIVVPEESVQERKNLLFASNDLPDAFFGGGLTPLDEISYGTQGLLIPLNDLIEEYGINIKKMFEDVPEMEQTITTPDGNIYALPAYQGNPHTLVTNKSWINITWLNKLGLGVPTTTDEFYEALKAFKNQDPNGNGKKDEIPFSFADKSGKSIVALFGSWGVESEIIVRDDKVILGYMEEGYKEGLKYFAKLFKEGLVDQEVFTQNTQQLRAKGSSDPQMVGSFINQGDAAIVGNAGVADYTALPSLRGPDGQQIYERRPIPVKKGRFAITKANQFPEVTLRWVDYCYSEQGGWEFSNGPENINWKRNNEGAIEFIPEPEGMEFGEFRHQNSPASISPCYRSITVPFVDNEQNIRLANYVETCYKPYWPEQIYPDLYYTPEQVEKMTPLTSSIEPYVQQMRAKFITGEADIDAGWDGYINTLKDMGAEQLLEIYQEAFDAYNR